MMTCFTPSPIQSNHVHFIDGALGGYTSAAIALKASCFFSSFLSLSFFLPALERHHLGTCPPSGAATLAA